ncbi:SigE family RNA polymerase sigma factor [Micromonospora endolithica]|uniref:SigE family RNA polymerase sigma factor n=1 Tax=Micromonospora endolithica TaxID=230091 RepID=A0A3A9ZHE4_9ACTN|nr:SigE family RNA polymerase sigma factor [Micromonospora endolithica]RKN47700.1 SigE family RNA polymerase sigma factor [Micromonospora endolithica]TWJ21373.1 RNA polymerase sigma-70 factor (sigma-E family) [Micromonospora endolithica]
MAADDEHFREFVDTRYMDLMRVAYHLTGSAQEAEDLVQSALVKVMRRWRRIDDPMAYLRRVMINQHISLWRRQRVHEVVRAVLPDRSTRDLTETVLERQALYEAMRELTPRTRAVIVLRYVADLPEAEVAATLGCSVGSVKSRASRGLARLRRALGPVPSAPATAPAAETTETATATTRMTEVAP